MATGQADPRAQAAFDTASKQAMTMLTDENAAKMIAGDAKTRGPDVAVISAVKLAMQGVQTAAKSAGVALPEGVIEAAEKSVAQVIVAMMVQSGLAKDPKALMASVEQGLAAEEAGEPESAPEAPAPGGALMQAREGAMQ